MNKKEYINIIKDCYKEYQSKEMCLGYAQIIYDHLMSLRYVKDEFMSYPKSVLEDLFKEDNLSKLSYYPCDVIELRYVIRSEKILTINPTIYFSFEFSNKHFQDYPLLLGFECEKKDDGFSLSRMNKNPELKRVYLREEYIETEICETIQNIIKDEKVCVDFNVISDVPGLKNKKFDLSVFNLLKFSGVEEIQFTEKEKAIFDFLRYVKQVNPQFANVVLRVAGGFVRDKLLGIPSDDIDIALSGITGKPFVEAIMKVGQTMKDSPVGKSYLVEQDVEKSKHLETAGVDIFGQKIEFVNLRTEIYDPASRIPVMAITDDPAADAIRRDLTINALFYNIDTGKVEDHVNGREDLKNMNLRTPLDPVKTFTDDPLRMLRVLRFYSKYPNSHIDPKIVEAMKNPEVQQKYSKLSTERASKEIRKMMEGDKAVPAVRILLETGLYKKVFQIPEDWHDITMDQANAHHKLNLMEHTLAVMENYDKIAKEQNLPKEERGLMRISTLMHDFAKMSPQIRKEHPKKPGQYRYIGHDQESARFAENIMTRMGFEPTEKKFVTTIISNHMSPHTIRPNMDPKAIGRFLNKTTQYYKRVMEHAHADELSKGWFENGEEETLKKQHQDAIAKIEAYRQQMGERVFKPVIDGNKIKAIVQEVAPEMVAKNAMIKTKEGMKPVHYMTYLIGQLMEQQWSQRVNNEVEADKFVRGAVKNIFNLWKSQQLNNPVDKKADASSSEGPDGGDGYEGNTFRGSKDDMVFMWHSSPTRFRKGSKVRMNTSFGGKGLGSEQIEGRVVSLNEIKMIVEWESPEKYKGKRTGYDLTDTVRLGKLNVI